MSADGLKTATGAKLAGLLLPGNFPTHRTHRSLRPPAVHTDRGTGSDCQPPPRWPSLLSQVAVYIHCELDRFRLPASQMCTLGAGLVSAPVGLVATM